MPVRRRLGGLLLTWLAVAPSAMAQETLETLRVVGTEFHLETSSGRVLRSRDLVGATLTVQQGKESLLLRIDEVALDPRDSTGETWLHHFSVQDSTTGQWGPLCEPDAEGRRLGFPLAGTSDETSGARRRTADTTFSLTCTAGVEAKCVLFGYKPWKKTAQGVDLWDYHQTCIRLLRADYCGQGQATTRDGTLVNIFDRLGIQKSEPREGMRFEAAWGPQGALCIHHPRIPENVTLKQLRACPRLAKAALGESCGEALFKGSKKALLFNTSF